MPKVKWTGSDITPDDIDSIEPRQFTPYDGPPLKAGVYGFRARLKKTESKASGAPMFGIVLVLVPRTGRPEDKRYDGAPVFDQITVMKSQAWRLRGLGDALGVSGADLISRVIADAEGHITKIGKVDIPDEGFPVVADIKIENDETYGERPKVRDYLPMRDQGDDPETPDDDPDEPSPF